MWLCIWIYSSRTALARRGQRNNSQKAQNVSNFLYKANPNVLKMIFKYVLSGPYEYHT